jgi:hypothetical protein
MSIARRYGLRWYGADTRTWVHRDRASAAGVPAALRWEEMSPDERWEVDDPDELLAMSIHAERAPMIVEDLREMEPSPLIVAEGSTISPAIVASGVADVDRAVWFLPTSNFEAARMDERGWPAGPRLLGRTVRASIEREAREHRPNALVLDGSRGVGDVIAAVETMFADALREGPRSESLGERRRLLRDANLSIIGQVRGYFARPWAVGDPETVVREFVCECGDPDCVESLQLEVGVVAEAPAVAPGHAPGVTDGAQMGRSAT